MLIIWAPVGYKFFWFTRQKIEIFFLAIILFLIKSMAFHFKLGSRFNSDWISIETFLASRDLVTYFDTMEKSFVWWLFKLANYTPWLVSRQFYSWRADLYTNAALPSLCTHRYCSWRFHQLLCQMISLLSHSENFFFVLLFLSVQSFCEMRWLHYIRLLNTFLILHINATKFLV